VQSIEDLPAGAEVVAAEEIDHAHKLDGSQIVEALQQVDEVYRAPLVLFYLQDMSYQEIAESLDVPIGTVMSRLSRGKVHLRRLLAQKENAASRPGTVVDFPDLKKGTAGK
jgi:RNA polymerase sigma-70 factor (ECF subfamily)